MLIYTCGGLFALSPIAQRCVEEWGIAGMLFIPVSLILAHLKSPNGSASIPRDMPSIRGAGVVLKHMAVM